MITIGLLTDFHSENRVLPFLEKICFVDEYSLETIDAFQSIESISQAVWGLINISDVLVAYVARESANLFYEIGLAHGLGKPVVLVTEESVALPGDLMDQHVLIMPKETRTDDNFLFRLRTSIDASQKRGRHHLGYRGLKPQLDSNFLINQEFTPSSDFRNLFAFEGSARARRFEVWFSELARGVPGWEVIEAERHLRSSGYLGFDFVLWNSLDDPELNAFGNPIAVELKAVGSMNSAMLSDFLHQSKNSGLKAIILATTGINNRGTKRRLARLRQEEGINAVALDRDDFLQVTSPKDLVRILKRKMRTLLYKEDF